MLKRNEEKNGLLRDQLYNSINMFKIFQYFIKWNFYYEFDITEWGGGVQFYFWKKSFKSMKFRTRYLKNSSVGLTILQGSCIHISEVTL